MIMKACTVYKRGTIPLYPSAWQIRGEAICFRVSCSSVLPSIRSLIPILGDAIILLTKRRAFNIYTTLFTNIHGSRNMKNNRKKRKRKKETLLLHQ